MDNSTLVSYPSCLLDSLRAQPSWLQYKAEIEDEYDRLCATGQALLEYAEAMGEVIQKLETYRLLSHELKVWMGSWELGAGFESAFAVANTLLRCHLESLDFSMRIRFRDLMETMEPEEAPSTRVRERALSLVLDLLSPEDLRTIAWAAEL